MSREVRKPEKLRPPKAIKRKGRGGDNQGGHPMSAVRGRRRSTEIQSRRKQSPAAQAARSLTCGEVMGDAHVVDAMDSMANVLDDITRYNWDHVFVLDENDVPLGRIHAVDVLKLIAKKTVNRNIAWMHSVPAQQLINLPPLTVRASTPLLKAAALLLTHDLNQLPVVDADGSLIGVIGHNHVARNLPRFIL